MRCSPKTWVFISLLCLVVPLACSSTSLPADNPDGANSPADGDAGVNPDAIDDQDTDVTSDQGADAEHHPTIDGTCSDVYDCREDQHCFGGFCVDEVGFLQFGDTEDEKIDDLVVDSEDNVVVTGYSVVTSGGGTSFTEVFFVSKYSPSGVLLWTQTADIRTMMTRTNHLAIDRQDNIYIAGTTYTDFDGRGVWDGIHTDAFVIKFNSAGEEQWRFQQIDADVSDHARGIALDAENRIFVVGDLINNRQFLAEFDNAGALIKTSSFGNRETLSHATDILCAPDGIYVTGIDDRNAFVKKFDRSFREIWSEEWKSTNDQRDVANAIILGEPGELFIAGNSSVDDPSFDPASNTCGDNGCHDIFLTKIVELGQGDNAIASVKWTSYLSMFPTADYAHDLVLYDGRITLAGSVETDAFLAPFYPNAAWRGPIACVQADCSPRLYRINSSQPPAGELGVPGDFVLSQAGQTQNLYNKQGARWDLVASSQAGDVSQLHSAGSVPEDRLGTHGDFFVNTTDSTLFERAVYDRAGFLMLSSGDDPSLAFDPTDFYESAQAVAVDSMGNFWIAGHTYGDFPNFENPATGHNFSDGLLVKIFR